MTIMRAYYTLTKPGIIFGNVITAIGGFLLASQGHFNFVLFITTMLGLSFIMGSGCVFNNYIDRFKDEKMMRTKKRVLVQGIIPLKNALVFGTILCLCGIFLLIYYTNILTACLAVCGFLIYVLLYSYMKHKTPTATLIGSLAGAAPIVVGYCSVTNRFDLGALLLFVILVLWQMPHFYAIAIYRIRDYAAAGIPVLPIKKGMYITKVHMLIYIVAFIMAVSLLTVFGFSGYIYLVIAVALGVIWLFYSCKGFSAKNDQVWARKMFSVSLVIITILCLTIGIESFIPQLKLK